MSEWISVKEQMPRKGSYYLLKVDSKKNPWAWWTKNIVIGLLDKGPTRWFLYVPGESRRLYGVKAWMPLPEPPK